MKWRLRALLPIALFSAVGCSLFLQIDDSQIPGETADAANESSSDALDALDTLETSLPETSLETMPPQDSATLDAAPDTVPDAVDDTSIADAIDTLEDGG